MTQFRAWAKRKANKYKAKSSNGFPSMLEEAVYELLLLRQRAGEINNIKRQQTVVLLEHEFLTVRWRVDFSAERVATGEKFYIEAKGVETTEYRKKLGIWKKALPADLEIWKGRYSGGRVTPILFLKVLKDGNQGSP